jgi:hypothetical protein
LGRSPRLVRPTNTHEGCGEPEMRKRIVSVDLNRATEQRDRLLGAGEEELRESRERHPQVGVRIARAKAKCLLDMSLGYAIPTLAPVLP